MPDIMSNSLNKIHSEVFKNIWKTLERATVDKKHSWRYSHLATIDGKNHPQVRMIVLRKVNSERRQLTFFTHYLSPKVEQIQKNPNVSCLFWNTRQNIQLRINGIMEVHYQNSVAAAYRETVPKYRLFEYTNSIPPGTKIRDQERKETDVESNDFFAVLQLQVDFMDWLELGREGHQRIKLTWNDQDWKGIHVMP